MHGLTNFKYENQFLPCQVHADNMCNHRYNCSVVIMAGLIILQLAIHIPDGRPKTFPVQLSGQYITRYDGQVLCDPDKRSLRSQKYYY